MNAEQTPPPNKEQIYDAEIFPLMGRIVEICQAHKIAMVASFHIPTPEDEDLHCNTALTKEEYAPSDNLKNAVKAILKRHTFAAFTITQP